MSHVSPLLPNLSHLPLVAPVSHDGEFKELSAAELEAMSAEEREAYKEHKAKHDAKKKKRIYSG
jgi:hypothetical protein